MRFGDWVYEQLEKNDRSINWLAKKVGCSHTAFLDYKKTDREVSTRVLMKTIEVLAEVSGKSEERVLLYVARHCYGLGVRE